MRAFYPCVPNIITTSQNFERGKRERDETSRHGRRTEERESQLSTNKTAKQKRNVRSGAARREAWAIFWEL